MHTIIYVNARVRYGMEYFDKNFIFRKLEKPVIYGLFLIYTY
jgi:hypothetical protein